MQTNIQLSLVDDESDISPPSIFTRDYSTDYYLKLSLLNDKFFEDLYIYHQKKGFWPIVISQICYVLTILFTLVFTTFVTTCVDWNSIHEGRKRDLSSAIYPSCLPENGRNTFLMFFIIIFFIWWLFTVIQSIKYVKEMYEIKNIWTNYLGPQDLTNSTWETIVERIRENFELPFVDVHYSINRILRWENYMIAMITKDIFKVEQKMFFGFTKVLEWNLKTCIKKTLFTTNSTLIKDVLKPENHWDFSRKLKKSFVIYGIYSLLLVPFVFSALSVYFVYRYVSEFHKNPKALGLFSFTPLAKWKLRDFNELEHDYILRLNKSHPKIIYFLSQFKSEILNILIKFFSFVFGSFLSILIFVSFFNSEIIISLFLIEIPVLFYVGVLGGMVVFLHSNLTDEYQIFEPDIAFQELVNALHYIPVNWESLTLEQRCLKLKNLFKYRIINLLFEIISVVYTPFLMIFYFSNKSDIIVTFFRENSVELKNLGIICSSALFSHGDHLINITNPKLKQKMSLSIINFNQKFPRQQIQNLENMDVHSECSRISNYSNQSQQLNPVEKLFCEEKLFESNFIDQVINGEKQLESTKIMSAKHDQMVSQSKISIDTVDTDDTIKPIYSQNFFD